MALNRLRSAIDEAQRVLDELSNVDAYERMGEVSELATDALQSVLRAREQALLDRSYDEGTVFEGDTTLPSVFVNDWRNRFAQAMTRRDYSNVEYLLSTPYARRPENRYAIQWAFEEVVREEEEEWIRLFVEHIDLEHIEPTILGMALAMSVKADDYDEDLVLRMLEVLEELPYVEDGLNYALGLLEDLPRSEKHDRLRARLLSDGAVSKDMPYEETDYDPY
jgi:hypothetical protein